MKKALLIFGLMLAVNFVYCQKDSIKETRTKNSIYLELCGNALIYSINYDRIFFGNGKTHLGFRVGGSYLPSFDDGETTMIPVELNLLIGKKNSFLELGFGETVITSQHNDFHTPTVPFMRIGYRFQRKKRGNGAMFRIAALPNLFR